MIFTLKSKLIAAITSGGLGVVLVSCSDITDDQKRTRVEGSIAGAMLGAVSENMAGLSIGHHVALKKTAYKSKGAWLDACSAQAEKTNAHARSYNASLSNEISNLEQKINAAKGRGDKGELQELKRAVLSLQNETKQEIKKVNFEILQQSRALNEVGNADSATILRTRIDEMRRTTATLGGLSDHLQMLGAEGGSRSVDDRVSSERVRKDAIAPSENKNSPPSPSDKRLPPPGKTAGQEADQESKPKL